MFKTIDFATGIKMIMFSDKFPKQKLLYLPNSNLIYASFFTDNDFKSYRSQNIDQNTAYWLSSALGIAGIFGRPFVGFLSSGLKLPAIWCYCGNQVGNTLFHIQFHVGLQ